MKEAGEIRWLLGFFSQPLATQWSQVPDDLGRVWVHVGEVDTKTTQPIRLLALVLSDLLNGCSAYFESGLGTAELEVPNELRILLAWFVLESPHDVVFSKLDEPDQLHRIWTTVGRLCRIALALPALKDINRFGYDYFLEHDGTRITG